VSAEEQPKWPKRLAVTRPTGEIVTATDTGLFIDALDSPSAERLFLYGETVDAKLAWVKSCGQAGRHHVHGLPARHLQEKEGQAQQPDPVRGEAQSSPAEVASTNLAHGIRNRLALPAPRPFGSCPPP
jgi:hypothetical protein